MHPVCPLIRLRVFLSHIIPRFRTCADLPGVEKLAVCSPDAAYLTAPYEPLPPLDPGSMLQCCIRSMIFVMSSQHVICFWNFLRVNWGNPELVPFSVAFVKGWRRSLSCLITCDAIKSLEIPFEELSTNFKAKRSNKIWEFHAHCKFMQSDEKVESWPVSRNHIIPVSGGRHLCGSCTEPLVDMVGSKTGSMPIAASPWEVWPPDVLQIALTFSGKSRSLRNLVWTERKHSQFLDGELSWAATCGLFWRLFSLIDYMKCKPKLITPFVPPKGPSLRSCPSKWGWLIAINLPFDQKI